MASWQAHLASLAVRASFKGFGRPRPAPADDGAALAHVRRKLNGKPRRPPRGVRFTADAVGGVAGEWIERVAGENPDAPTAATDRRATPVLLYLHGGGYIACSPTTHRPVTAALARRLGRLAPGARVFAPAYRLAPEHPYPAAVDDALAAHRGLLALGIPAARVAVAGDSAGGGLALALLVALRDAGGPLPAAGVLFSPWTDLAVTGASVDENSRRCAMFTAEQMRRGPRAYLAGADPRTPTASPLYADLAGLPPLLVHASRDETLRDDATRLAERARDAGVDVTARLFGGVPHVWQFWDAAVPEARASLDEAAAFVVRFIADQKNQESP